MNRLYGILPWGMIVLGTLHMAATFTLYDRLDGRAIWFFNGGIVLVFGGGLNLVNRRYGAGARLLRWFTRAVNVVTLAFAAVSGIVTGGSVASLVIVLALMGAITFLSFHEGSSVMERAVPILPGDDIAAAKDFYVRGLGFRVSWEWTEDGKNGLMGVERGGLAVTIDCPMSGHGRNACVSLHVADADALYDEWRQRVTVEHPPKNEDWKARTFGVTDPFGNTVFVIGPPK